MKPKVSVIIPVYNCEKYLPACLDSVLAQTLKELEIICVDDGSTDSSPRILEEYAEKDKRVAVITEKNSGAGAARNAGLRLARGEYLSFLDADDFFAPQMLEEAYAKAGESRADVVIFGATLYDNATRTCSKMPHLLNTKRLPPKVPFAAQDAAENIFAITTPAPWNKLWRRDFVLALGVSFMSTHNTNDLAFVMTCLALAQKITYVNEALMYYRVRDTKDNCQSSKNKYPYDFLYALRQMKESLARRGVYDIFKEAFLRFAETQCAFNFRDINYCILSAAERKKICAELSVPFTVMTKNNRYESLDPRSAFCVRDVNLCPPQECSKTVSLVVPVYNVEKYLPACLDSLLRQSYGQIEIICVDGGSTDGCRKILQAYARADDRVRLLEKDKNEGSLLARADGAAMATGEYLLFIDADDYLEFDAVRQLVLLAREHPADILRFTVGVEYYGCEEQNPWLKNTLAVKCDKRLDGEEILAAMFLTKEVTTSPVGKLFRTETVRAACAKFSADRDYYFVSEDIYTSFFLAFCADTYAQVKTGPLYWYRRGTGVSGSYVMPLRTFEQYCRMAGLAERVKNFLASEGAAERCGKYCEAMRSRLLEDCLRIYKYRIARQDKFAAGQLLLKYWGAQAADDDAFLKFTGRTAQNFALAHTAVREYVKPCRKNFAPKVSVIVPVFNEEKYLRECLESILAQAPAETEIICVNDGSYDASLSILENYYARCDRLCLVSKQNAGQGLARNAGLEYARGKYIYFIDSDDCLERGALEALYTRAEADNLDALYFEARPFAEADVQAQNFAIAFPEKYCRAGNYPEVYDGPALCQMFLANRDYFPTACLTFLRADFIRENGLRFPHGLPHEDNAFAFAALLRAKRCGVLHRAFYSRRVHNNSTMTRGVTFNNAYGYFLSFLDMARTLAALQPNLSSDVCAAASEQVMNTLRSAQSCYRQMPAEDRNCTIALGDDLPLFRTLVARPGELLKEKSEINAKLQRTYKEKSEINAKLQRTYKEKSERGVQIKKLRAELSQLRNSRSYRIGRAITFVPRKIRGAVKCYRQHGAAYTFNRLLVHLGIKEK